MRNIAVFFGGKSCEHDISIITAQQAIAALSREKYNVIPVYMDRNGGFNTGKNLDSIEAFNKKQRLQPVYLSGNSPNLFRGRLFAKRVPIYAAVICNHGLGGEDGTLQGVLELAGIPYTSCGVLASAAGMDKIMMKKVFKSFGIPTVAFVALCSELYAAKPEKLLRECERRLGYPAIVKPSNLGSSIGITKANNREELVEAIKTAFCYDSRVLVERAVVRLREINCSALKQGEEIKLSPLEEPLAWHDVLSFEDKYMGGAKEGMAGQKRRLPANLCEAHEKKILRLTSRIYTVLDCKGVVRVDYIIDEETGRVYANEINTIPGSLSFYLWEFAGLCFGDMLDILIDQAVKERQKKEALTYSFNSPVLRAIEGAKSPKCGR